MSSWKQSHRENREHRKNWRLFLCRFIAIWCFGVALSTSGAGFSQQLTTGTSSRNAKDEAIKCIPLHDMTPDAQAKISAVLQDHSLYRRLPMTQIECDSEYYTFLCRYPEVIVSIWRLMGVTEMDSQRTGPFELHTEDGAGGTNDVELIYGNDQIHVFYGTGKYEGPVLRKPVNGQCVLVLRTSSADDPTGKSTQTSKLDIFLKIENAAAGIIAKTLNPLVGKTADQNFVETMKFVQRLNETTSRNGPGVQGMAYRLDGLTPEVRQSFIDVAGRVFERSQPEASFVVPATAAPSGLPSEPSGTPIRYTTTPPGR
jgi:hypothetical protein